MKSSRLFIRLVGLGEARADGVPAIMALILAALVFAFFTFGLAFLQFSFSAVNLAPPNTRALTSCTSWP